MDAAAAFSSRFSAANIEERCAAGAGSLDACLRSDQAFFVYNAAHLGTSIRSPDGTAWIRPLGFCPSIKAAKERGMAVHATDKGQEIRMQPSGKCFLVGAAPYADTPEALDIPAREREQAKANQIMESVFVKAEAKIKDVKQRAEARVAGALDLSLMDPRRAADKPALASTATEPAQPAGGGGGASPAVDTPLADVPVHLEQRSQRFAVLAVIDDEDAAQEYKERRTRWWSQRAAKLRTNWRASVGVAADWRDTLATWLAENPVPPVADYTWPLFINFSWPEATQKWCVARDEALLEAEWRAAGREGPHNFDYSAELGDESDVPPAPAIEEPVIVAIGACETLEDAEKLAAKAGSTQELRHVDVFVCAMYEWGRVGSRHATVAKKSKRHLDEIMPSLSK